MFSPFNRLRVSTGIVVMIAGVFVGVAILLMFIPNAATYVPQLAFLPRQPRSLWFNESKETNLDFLHEKRRWVMQETCRKINNSYSNKATFNMDPARFYNIYVNDEYKFLYCSVPKVACSNWKRALLSLLGVNKTDQIPNTDLYDYGGRYYNTIRRMQLSMYTKEEVEYRIKNYRKFIFVREPFERLLSAWRNKFTVASNLYFQSRWGSYIIKNYRENPSKESLNKGSDVTYPEFVRFLLSPKTVRDEMHNDHWQPYETLCYPCIVDYDYVGKYTTMDNDIAYIAEKLNIQQLQFPARNIRYKHAPTVNYVDQEYAKIALSDIHQIYENYKSDFAVFNYQYKTFDKFDPLPPAPAVTL